MSRFANRIGLPAARGLHPYRKTTDHLAAYDACPPMQSEATTDKTGRMLQEAFAQVLLGLRLGGFAMNSDTHQTAPTQFLEANGIRFAYRRFGKANGVPLVFNQHYLGTMDYWDPTVTDGLAPGRAVILFNNAGVSSSSGEVPTTFEQMAANAIAFIKALALKQVDLFGFSIGGMVAQEITL